MLVAFGQFDEPTREDNTGTEAKGGLRVTEKAMTYYL